MYHLRVSGVCLLVSKTDNYWMCAIKSMSKRDGMMS